MPSIDDGNRGVKSSAELAADQAETNRVIKKYSKKTSAGTGPVGRGSTNYNTTKSNTGANYPAGYYKGNALPTTKVGMLLAALKPTAAMLKTAGKTFWNQTKYGMNDAVKVHYDKMVKDGLPTGMSVQDAVNAARELYHVDNDKSGKPTRGDENADINSMGATHTVSEDGTVVEDTPETVKAEMGKIGLHYIGGPDGRPSWAPKDPNYVDPNAYVKTPYDIAADQAYLGMDEWQRQEDLRNAPAVDPYAPSAPVTDGARPDWAPTIPKDTDSTYDPYAPTWNQSQIRIPEEGYYGNWNGGDNQLLGPNTGGMLTNQAGQQERQPPQAQAQELLARQQALQSQGRPNQGPQYSQVPQARQAPQSQAAAYELAARQGMILPQVPQAPQAPYQAQAPRGTPAYDSLQREVAVQAAPTALQYQNYAQAAPAAQAQAPQVAIAAQAPTAVAQGGAAVPTGTADSGTFKPVTFRSGTGTSTTTEDGTTTSLNDPYSSLSNLVGSGQGLLTQAATNAQQAPDQLSFDMNTDQRAADLFAQRSALLDPAFAQQRALAKQDMFGSGRLGLRLAGEAVGAGVDSGMVQPDAFGMNQAQAQALAGLASQSTDDAFARSQAIAGLDSQRFGQNQQAQQQQYANLMGSGQGMLSAGIQGAQLESDIAQQQLVNQQARQEQGLSQQRLALDAQAQAQNFGLASQGQTQDYGLNQAQFNLASRGQSQDFGLAQAGQSQNYGLAQQQASLAQNQFNLSAQGQAQNFGLAQQTQDQAYGLNQQNFALNERGQMQDYGLAQDRFGLAQQTQDQANVMANKNFGLSSRNQDLAELSNRQNFGLASERMALDTLGQQQNFGLANRGQNLAELSNNQNFGLNTERMALDTLNQKDRLAFDTLGQTQNYGLQQQQQMQDYGLNQQKMDLATQQQVQDYGFGQQNYGLAAQQQYQDYGLNQQKMAMANQQQLQDYEMGMLTGNRNYNLARDVAAQNYELETEQNRINLITGQARANKDNYQPNDWLNLLGGGLNAYAGTAGGAANISGWVDTGLGWLTGG